MFRSGRLLYKCISAFLAICLISGIFTPCRMVFAEKQFTMKQAVQFGIKNSDELFQLNLSLVKKNIELNQARQGLADIRRKEKTVQFSLLFNIKLPEGHGMPKEIELVTKIPGIQSEINELKKSIEFTTNKIEYDVKIAYLNVVSDDFNVENRKKVLEEETKTADMLEQQYKIGKATQDQVKNKNEEIDSVKQAFQKAVLNFENDKSKLSDLVGIDLTYGYSFERSFITADIARSDLNEITDYSREKSFDVYKANAKLALSESKVQMIRGIYRNAFGSAVNLIEAELNKPGDIDYNVFMSKYDKTLEMIGSKWEGFFFIPLLFFVIPIPKSWIQPEYAGLRYFENEKYALPNAMMERDIDKKEYEKTVKDHDKSVSDGYLSLKELEMSFKNSVDAYEKSLEEYDKAVKMNKIGKLTFEELEGKKKDSRDKAFAAVNSMLDYNKQIYMYNFQTGGAISKYFGSTKVTISSLDTGISFLPPEEDDTGAQEEKKEEKPGSEGMWFIDSSNIDYRVYFRVQVPESLGATHFSLFTSERRQIGTKTKITERIPHIPILFTDTEQLTVELYKDNQLLGVAKVDGFDVQGKLVITPPEQSEDGNTGSSLKGTWEVKPESIPIKSDFTIGIDGIEYTHFELFSKDGVMIGSRTEADKPITHLTSVFADMEGMSLKLYNKDKLVAYCILAKDGQIDITPTADKQ